MAGEGVLPVAGSVTTDGHLLFNFSASYSGGGFKRLFNYAKWFDAHGGAVFIIHPKIAGLTHEFPRNRYVVVSPSWWARLWNDGSYLAAVLHEFPKPSLYYAYGIPMYSRIGAVNWFHLSNALPVAREAVPMGWGERLKFAMLGRRIRRGLANADVIAAESESSLDLLGRKHGDRLFLSANGFDDGLSLLGRGNVAVRDEIAVVVGTYRYKALEDALCVFEMLRKGNPLLRLHVFGDVGSVPLALRESAAVDLLGTQPPSNVIDALKRARFYISTSHIENSSNADMEGVFLAEEAWLSDIPSHRELLGDDTWETFTVRGMNRTMLRVRGAELPMQALKSWQSVVCDMLARFALARLANATDAPRSANARMS
jgi:glycosyltransferase involved in cell wall biosynthesis